MGRDPGRTDDDHQPVRARTGRLRLCATELGSNLTNDSRALVRAGATCTILTTDVGINTDRRNSLEGVEVVALPCLVKRFYVPAVSLQQLSDLVNKCDVIELTNHWTIINALVYFTAKRFNKPYIVCPAGALSIYGRSRWLKTLYNWVVGKKIICNASGRVAISIAEIPQFMEEN